MSIQLVAEVATNHGGNIRLAKDFIKAYADAGADIIKFQLTRAQYLRPGDPQTEWFQQCERPLSWYAELAEECRLNSVTFLATVFTPIVLAELRQISSILKIGSGESHDGRMARAVVAAEFDTVWVSSGLGPINSAYSAHRGLREVATASLYPTPLGMVSRAFAARPYDGWSDHCIGLNDCFMASQYGITYLEKHVCLKNQARPIRPWEASTQDFQELRQYVDRDGRKEYRGRWQHGTKA